MSRLKNWAFVDAVFCDLNPHGPKTNLKQYCSPLHVALQAPHTVSLFGYIYDDPRKDTSGRFADGHRIVTSRLRSIDLIKGQVQTTSGTIYTLDGDANIVYQEFNNKWQNQ